MRELSASAKVDAFVSAQADPKRFFAGYLDVLDCYKELVDLCGAEMCQEEFLAVFWGKLAPAFDVIVTGLET